jgi:RHS repeat-associated protein
MDHFDLINMNGRAYDPTVGRFLSADPVIQNTTSTQSYNRYSYCLNNPLKYTDPSGYISVGWQNVSNIITNMNQTLQMQGYDWYLKTVQGMRQMLSYFEIASIFNPRYGGGYSSNNVLTDLEEILKGYDTPLYGVLIQESCEWFQGCYGVSNVYYSYWPGLGGKAGWLGVNLNITFGDGLASKFAKDLYIKQYVEKDGVEWCHAFDNTSPDKTFKLTSIENYSLRFQDYPGYTLDNDAGYDMSPAEHTWRGEIQVYKNSELIYQFNYGFDIIMFGPGLYDYYCKPYGIEVMNFTNY